MQKINTINTIKRFIFFYNTVVSVVIIFTPTQINMARKQVVIIKPRMAKPSKNSAGGILQKTGQ